MKALISIACLLLAGNLYLGFEERQARIKAGAVRMDLVQMALADDAAMDKKRALIFTEMQEAMDAYDTKSIYHQIYHVNRAQLKMQDLAVQEHQLLLRYMANK